MKNLPPRRERRAAWREANRWRFPGDPRSPWTPSPVLSPLAAHALAKRRAAGGQSTLLISLGLNRAQRLALKSKKGPRRMLEHGRPTSTPAQSFLPGKGRWNRHALLIDLRRRLALRQEFHRRANRWWRRWPREVRLFARFCLWKAGYRWRWFRSGRWARAAWWWAVSMPAGWVRSALSRASRLFP